MRKGGLIDRVCSVPFLRPALRAVYVNRDLPAMPWLYLRSRLAAPRLDARLGELRHYCMFVGYSASGSSLLGSMLDAHPDVVMGHELDALRYLCLGFSGRQLFWLILDNDRKFTVRARTHHGYDYAVPNQWQGRYRSIQVIGDKLAGYTTRRLGEQPRLLDRLRAEVRVPLRVIHLVRSPYDNIASLWKLTMGLNLSRTAEYYFSLAEINAGLRERLAPEELLEVHHEQVVSDPSGQLARICRFLGLECPEQYLHDCAGIVFTKPRQTRSTVDWPNGLLAEVDRRIAGFDFLRGYVRTEESRP